MEIVKELNLNKTPQSVKNYSLICAKNIKISNDGQYITNEDGIEAIFVLPDDSYNIVGLISCNAELVIFAYSSDRRLSKIFRYYEKSNSYSEIPNSWKWGGGDIRGTYTYNINNELIVAIAEYSSTVSNIALKTINLNTCSTSDNESDYNLNPNIVPSSLKFKGFSSTKDCKTGTYYFFIRYKISSNNYTKWFPIGIPTMSYSFKRFSMTHQWKNANGAVSNTSPSFNIIGDSGYNSIMELEVRNSLFKSCELAYIVDRDSGTYGRIWNEYKLAANEINTFQLEFNSISYREVGVDELLESGLNLYNVKNIANYNNRLYISNYEEDNINLDISEYAKSVSVSYKLIPVTDPKAVSLGYGTLINERGNIRTLVPGDVYSFYLHFVKSDGTYTNGSRIGNSNPDTTVLIGNKTYDTRTNTMRDVINSGSYPAWVSSFVGGGLLDVPLFYIINTVLKNDSDNRFAYYANDNKEVFFRVPDCNIEITKAISPVFKNITIPKGYIGAFISYEEVEPIVRCTGMNGIFKNAVASSAIKLRLNSLDTIINSKPFDGILYKEGCTLSLNNYFGAMFFKSESANRTYDLSNCSASILPPNSTNNIARESAILVEDALGNMNTVNIEKQYTEPSSSTSDYFTIRGFVKDTNVGYIIAISRNIYNNKYKKLISLGQIAYKSINSIETVSIGASQTDGYLNLPAYVTSEQNLIYHKDGAVISDEAEVTNSEGAFIGQYALNLYYTKYSYSFLELLDIKIHPEKIVNIISSSGTKYYSSLVRPSNSAELFQLKPQNIISEKNVYFKYDKESLFNNVFLKTIRRSDVLQTESLINKWTNFKADAYKYISENKGNITNIVGVGVYLLVHTEHSLFMFNRDASLKTRDKDVQLTIPDAFDTEYQEVFTSDMGYGGLQDSDAWCVNEYGYTFFDNSAKRLYSFDDGKLNILSLDIAALLDNLNIVKVVIANDATNDRIIVSIHATRDNESLYITLSYNYLSKSWIALHDYCFNKTVNTKDRVYLTPVDSTKLVYTFDKANHLRIGDFKELAIKGMSIFPVYSSDMDNSNYSYVDIIFNDAYETSKALVSIDYVLSELVDYISEYMQAEGTSNNKYSGFQLQIYTDCTKTAVMDINTGNVGNKFNNYKYPYFDKGKWNFNYFRNYSESNKSDSKSRIYGKYIVARFIFNTESNARFKLENINFNVSKY